MTTARTIGAADTALHLMDEVLEHLGTISSGHADEFDLRFHSLLGRLDRAASDTPEQIQELRRKFLILTEQIMSRSAIIDHGRKKPFGYSGDYQIIDWTYQQYVGGGDRLGVLLDEFYHRQVAPRAVRDRKARLGRVLSELSSVAHGPIRMLNVGSGSGREIVDGAAVAGLGPEDFVITCVEMDPQAIAFATSLLGPTWERSVRFWQGNAIRYRPDGQFDLVWSAGLFDYLNSRLAASLLRRLWSSTAPGGRLIIGNFVDTHPTRPWIEWCGDWYLIHRTLAELRDLASAAGIPASSTNTYTDDWGAVGFLDCTRKL